MVDWTRAIIIASIGFGGVFAVLIALMLSMMLIGYISRTLVKASEKKQEK